jgi:hypothetical protein
MMPIFISLSFLLIRWHERARLVPRLSHQVKAPREQGRVHGAQGVVGWAAADRRDRVGAPAGKRRAVAHVGQSIDQVLGDAVHVIHIDRAGQDDAIGGVHLGLDGRDVISERTAVLSPIKAGAAAPAWADIHIAEVKRLECQRFILMRGNLLELSADHLHDPGRVSVFPTTTHQGKKDHSIPRITCM